MSASRLQRLGYRQLKKRCQEKKFNISTLALKPGKGGWSVLKCYIEILHITIPLILILICKYYHFGETFTEDTSSVNVSPCKLCYWVFHLNTDWKKVIQELISCHNTCRFVQNP